MNDIHSREFKKSYLKSKIKLKQWENKFFAENGRLPSKIDIKASPASVKEYYKLYWKLKTQILEAEILGEDRISEETSNLNKLTSDFVLKEYTNRVEEINNSHKHPTAFKENINTPELVSLATKTWGSHLNRRETVSVIEKEKCTLLNETIAGRLFKGSSFKKRNPRKSLSFSKKKTDKSVSAEENKSIDCLGDSSVMSPFSDCQNDAVDLSLNTSAFSVENDCSSNIKALITSSASLSPLLNKPAQCKDLKEKMTTSVQPISLIQVVASDPSSILKPSRSIDLGWVERCSQVDTKEERKSSDSGFESMEFSQVLEQNYLEGTSEDDLIADSDNEYHENSKCNFVSQKRKPEFSPVQPSTNFNKDIDADTQQACKKIKMNTHIEETKPKTKDEVKKAILEKKIQTGKLNENFVRINLKKKVFVRGKKNFNFAKYKRREWKKKKKKNLNEERNSGIIAQCYSCGETGHFSKQCGKGNEDKLLEADEDEGDELLTLEEAEKMAKEKAEEKNFKRRNTLTFEKPQKEINLIPKVEPFYSLNDDGTLLKTPSEVYEALQKFGHTEFRPGQEETIMRILSGQSTLVTIATGGGKSLCYQLPAYLYANRSKCMTLVISPLVSLMEDQVSGSSSFFKIGCLHTSQTEKQRETIVQEAKTGKLYALLVSPEAVVSGDFSGLGHILRQLPPIAFVCIDEVHCISQWSHNFRPSYLMISKVLKNKLGVSTILGLTATASLSTVNSITAELGINKDNGVIRDVPLPDNLSLSVSRDENKDEALINLLRSSKFKDANAILIYCTRRDECEKLASYIRTRLHDPVLLGGNSSSSSWNAESYHAGMAAARRKQVQKAFMRGNLRIVVATVAFGMGINKQDIRGVIHYNMPKDFESYVQEVGRAGRDGKPAYCHLFLDSKGCDLFELRRHIYSSSVDRHVLRKLLQRVFIECDCVRKEKSCQGHEIAFDFTDTIQALDIPEENIHTLLCYLELHQRRFIKVLTPVYVNCKIKSYKGMKKIISVAKKCPPLAYACALKPKTEKSEVLEFDVIKIANKLGWDSALVKNQLKNIEWELTRDGKWKKTGIAVEFNGLGFRVCSRGDMTPSELDEALNYLIQRVENREKRANAELDIFFSTFDYFAKDDYSHCLDNFNEHLSKNLKSSIQKYFETEELCSEIPVKQLKVDVFDEEAVIADIRTLICTYRDNTFNGRAVARIFHGIQSPNYPASIWYKCKFWRKHIDKDFNKISRLATVEILRRKI